VNVGILSISKIKEKLKTSHFHIALAAGISILAIATFSKWVFTKPVNPFLLTIPPLIEAAYEGVLKKYKEAKFLKTWYWVCAIILSTAIIIIVHLVWRS